MATFFFLGCGFPLSLLLSVGMGSTRGSRVWRFSASFISFLASSLARSRVSLLSDVFFALAAVAGSPQSEDAILVGERHAKGPRRLKGDGQNRGTRSNDTSSSRDPSRPSSRGLRSRRHAHNVLTCATQRRIIGPSRTLHCLTRCIGNLTIP